MVDIANLTSTIANFISANKEKSPPRLLDPSLNNITPIIEIFKQSPEILQTITKLSKYCAFYENYSLAHQLLDWALHLYPNEHNCYYFKAILYFKQQNLPEVFQEIENMLKSMNTSETQKAHILSL